MMRIAITSGEPAGIGPELCLQLLQWQAGGHPLSPVFDDLTVHPVILCDRDLLASRAAMLGLTVPLRDYHPDQAYERGVLDVLHIPLTTPCQPGQLDPANAGYVIDLLDRALAGCLQGEFAAMVTAPLHKGVINQAGRPFTFTGHTEYLAGQTNTPRVVMMLAGETPHGPLRVALATTHLPLRDVPAAITPELLTDILHILHHDLQQKYGIATPRILVTGLNPHAGEGGYLGREEIDVITPTLARLRAEAGMSLIGPLPADTLFTPPVLAKGDAVLAMYHDQGLAPLKYATFGHGINVTLGLPVIRTSVDHGTALELAGTGKAHSGSLFEAVHQAAIMADRMSSGGSKA